MSKVICPVNKEHKKFTTVAHEVHDWIVDGEGNFVSDLGCVEVSVEPHESNVWYCHICGAEAVKL